MDQIVTPAVFKLFGRRVYTSCSADANGSPTAWDDAWLAEPAVLPGANRMEVFANPAPILNGTGSEG